MASSWPCFWNGCRSRLSAIGRSCFLGRQKWKARELELRQELQRLQQRERELQEQAGQQAEQLKVQEERVRQLEGRIKKLEQRGGKLPEGRRPGGAHYCDRVIELAVNLSREIGFRPSRRAMRVMFDWLGVKQKIPSFQSCRTWMQRIGLSRMKLASQREGGTWLVDHTMQLGNQKVLTILRVRRSWPQEKPAALKHSDVEVLAMVLGREWTYERIGQVYLQTAQRYGMPQSISSDGAKELQEPAKRLEIEGQKAIVTYDPKHWLANWLKKRLAGDQAFQDFRQRLQRTTASVQQTELAHLAPPRMKLKARFMNLEPLLTWAEMVLWHLEHPVGESHDSEQSQRMQEKFGWLTPMREALTGWQECQHIINTCTHMIAREGLSGDTARRFLGLAKPMAKSSSARALLADAVKFLRAQQKPLAKGDRLAVSTEVLESSYARYKQLEKQHSKSGFSGLLLTFPALLKRVTVGEVHRSFKTSNVHAVTQWVKDNLPTTVAMQRKLAYQAAKPTRAKPATKRATANLAYT